MQFNQPPTTHRTGIMAEMREHIRAVLREGTERTGRPLKTADIIRAVMVRLGFYEKEGAAWLSVEAGKRARIITVVIADGGGKLWDRVRQAYYAPLGWASKKEKGAV
jgi:hypothetical protein